MKSILTVILIFICSVCFAYEITVYGVSNCGYTTGLRNELTAKGISFTYCDVNYSSCMNEMVQVAYDNNLLVNGTIYFPIVKITEGGKTTGLCRPSVTDIIKLIKTTSIVTIQNGIISSSKKGIDIYNVHGVKILHSSVQEMNISNLPRGVYIVNGIKIIK